MHLGGRSEAKGLVVHLRSLTWNQPQHHDAIQQRSFHCRSPVRFSASRSAFTIPCISPNCRGLEGWIGADSPDGMGGKHLSTKGETLYLLPQNTWYSFYCNISEEVILSMADLIVDYGFKDLGYEYVLIDDCCNDNPPCPHVLISGSRRSHQSIDNKICDLVRPKLTNMC